MALKLLSILLILVLHSKAPESHWVPHRPPSPPVDSSPLCASQFALVNRACSMLPYTPVPPPAPPSPPSPDDGPESSHRHRQHHHHGHSHSHHRHRRHESRETPVEEECCRWLKEVDNVCVCDLLVHLQPFLTRPVHNYTVVVDDSCDVTFRCGSRLVN